MVRLINGLAHHLQIILKCSEVPAASCLQVVEGPHHHRLEEGEHHLHIGPASLCQLHIVLAIVLQALPTGSSGLPRHLSDPQARPTVAVSLSGLSPRHLSFSVPAVSLRMVPLVLINNGKRDNLQLALRCVANLQGYPLVALEVQGIELPLPARSGHSGRQFQCPCRSRLSPQAISLSRK